MVKKKSQVSLTWIWQYVVAGIAVAGTIWAFYQYATLLRGGIGGLSSLNNSLAMGTLFLLGIVLLLGPLARMFSIFDGLLQYRKQLGVLTFFTSLIHVYLSMFVLARRGPLGFYVSQPLSAYSGLAALVIMFILVVISLRFVEQKLGSKLWWQMQYWGARIAFVLITFHMVVLKYPSFISWFNTGGLPPFALLGAVFAAFVFTVRLSELFASAVSRFLTECAFFIATSTAFWLFFRR